MIGGELLDPGGTIRPVLAAGLRSLALVGAVVLSAGGVSGAPSAAADDPAGSVEAVKVRDWLEANVPERMRKAKMPGFAIAVVKDGEQIYAEGFGARDLERNLPVTRDTLFGIGSVTKSFVAIGILQLAEAQKLDLDDPVSLYTPLELGLPGQPIRIRHLLTHSPGFPDLGTSTVLISRGLGRETGVPMTSAADFYRFINGAEDEVIFAPGEHFFYNNAAWRMLGHILQEVSGMPFHRYLAERVIRPLGMTRTTLDTAKLFADPDHLTPYRAGPDGPEPAKFPYPSPEDNPDFSFLAAAGGISSSVNEMVAYMNALIDGGAHQGGQLVTAESMAEMQSLQIHTGEGSFGVEGYGYGLSIEPDFLGHKRLSHGGSIAVSTAHLAFVPKLRAGVVMMGNSSGMDYGAIADAVLAILMGHDPEAALPDRAVRERMRSLTGGYATYADLETTEVVERGGMLYLGSGESAEPLIPEDPSYETTRFYTLDGAVRSSVEFKTDDQGKTILLVGRYVYHQRE